MRQHPHLPPGGRRIITFALVALILANSFTLLWLLLLPGSASAAADVPRDACSASGPCANATPLPPNCTEGLGGTVACSFDTPTPTPKPVPASAPIQHTLRYTVCPPANQDPAPTAPGALSSSDGTKGFYTDGTWSSPVHRGSPVPPAAYPSTEVVSYQGGSGLNDQDHPLTTNTLLCSGDYYYGWDQYYHKAFWDAGISLQDMVSMSCAVEVYIPSWYAGAPNPTYTFSVTPDGGSEQVLQTVNNWSQSHDTNSWYSPFASPSGDLIYYPVSPLAADNSYTLHLTLTNGGTAGYYLGADAAQFVCNYMSSK